MKETESVDIKRPETTRTCVYIVSFADTIKAMAIAILLSLLLLLCAHIIIIIFWIVLGLGYYSIIIYTREIALLEIKRRVSKTKMAIKSIITNPSRATLMSQGRIAHGIAYFSGQVPIRADGSRDVKDVKEACRLIIDILKETLAAAGLTFADALKVNIYLTNMGDYDTMNAVYEEVCSCIMIGVLWRFS